jgi:hypothetical protein
MKPSYLKWMQWTILAAAVGVAAAIPLHAELLEKTTKISGTTVQYKVVLPNLYDRTKAYPAILAFGGGPQNMGTVDSILTRNFREEAERRGYIVIAPAAPEGQLFFEEGARILPRIFETDSGGLQNSGQQVSHRRPVKRRNSGISCRGRKSAVFPLCHGFPGLHVAAQHGKAAGDFKNVRVHVRGRAGRIHVARRNEIGGGVSSLQRHRRPIHGRKGTAPPDGTLAGANARRLFEGFEETKKGCSK